MEKKKVAFVFLGCDKNRVDSEKAIAKIAERHALTDDLDSAQIIIVNTCAFLNSSRKESIQKVLELGELKKTAKLEKLIVTGCLPQKYADELFTELTEADAFCGVSDYGGINRVIERLYDGGGRINAVGEPKYECGKSRYLSTDGYAYLKIADGCDNHCTYCLIPAIRGKYRSVPTEDLIEEVKGMGKVRELILVAQDTTRYGADLPDKTDLVTLIRRLSALSGVGGIRLLYCYPEGITDELIHELKVNAKLIKYIDIPLQHASDRILKLMNRKGTGDGYLRLIQKLKAEVAGIAIRSTFITGFPTETEEDHGILCGFLQKAELFNAGFFKYSREEGTPAYKLDGQLPESVKTKRLKQLYSAQKKVVKKISRSLAGKRFKVFCEGFDQNMLCYYGRAYFNAPEVDGKIYFFSAEETVKGGVYDVKIIKGDGYDLIGERI